MFRVWAPAAGTVELVLADDRRPMEQAAGGWWETVAAEVGPGSDYRFAVDGGDPLPDPRSCWQPHGVHQPSRVLAHDQFQWTDVGWPGRPLPGRLVYEMHVGTFTREGTFDAAAERLPYLVDLGVDFVQLMPVHAFDGRHGWGYDGVCLFAVHQPYGGPVGLKRFVDAAHRLGLGVLLDVVYNHLGPSGNHLADYGPYFTDRYATPWGPAVNLDGPDSNEVRRFFIDNALSWLRDYHLDGLRLDAVHALADARAVPLLEGLAAAVHALGARQARPLSVVAESELNDPRLVRPVEAGGFGLDAQWSDDFHHALHAALTGERQGYYADFGSLATLAKAMQAGFVHDGCWSSFRARDHGRPVDRHAFDGHRLLGYLQTHDQVGNRAGGERSSALMSTGLLQVGAALVLCSAFTPMLFMGEEWAAASPWQFFTSFADPELGTAVSAGRRAEFAAHGWPAEQVPDPQDPATFTRSRLNWAELAAEPHAQVLGWHRQLIALRRAEPALSDGRLDRVAASWDEERRWFVLHRGNLAVVCNLATERQPVPVAGGPTEVLAASASGFTFADRVVELAGESVVVARMSLHDRGW